MNRFCSECGGLMNQETGECTNCHKKAFVPANETNNNAKKPDLKKILIIAGLALLLIIAGIFVFRLFGSNKKKNDIDYRERIETTYSRDGTVIAVATSEYDEDGNQTYYEYDYQDGYYYYAYKYKLDDNGYPVKMTQYDKKDSEPSQVYTYENEYDRKKNRISMQRYLNDKYNGYTDFEYDKNGNVIRTDVYDENDDLIAYYVYEYDKRGNRTLCDYYEGDSDDPAWGYIYEFDDKDNPIRYEYYENGKLSSSSEYENEYDKKGNLIRYDYYRDDKLDASYECEYDKKGRKIFEQAYDSEGKEQSYTEIEYID